MNHKNLLVLIIILLLLSCKPEKDEQNENKNLILIDTIELRLNEPSGMTFNNINNLYYIVSDNPNSKIYSVDNNGTILDSLNYLGDDLEGIVFNKNDLTIWVSEERLIQLVKLNTSGQELDRIELEFIPYDFDEVRIEGLTIDLSRNSLFLLNEKNPGAIIEIDIDNLTLKDIYYLDFASDYSAIGYIEEENQFIILSDEDKKAFFWDISAGVTDVIELGYSKAEGIAYDSEVLYIVSEKGNSLYKYKIE